MANTFELVHVPGTRQPATIYGYPGTAHVFSMDNSDCFLHFIWYDGAPAALFNNAPNGSFLYDATDHRLYIKDGTRGLTNGAWKYGSIAT